MIQTVEYSLPSSNLHNYFRYFQCGLWNKDSLLIAIPIVLKTNEIISRLNSCKLTLSMQ